MLDTLPLGDTRAATFSAVEPGTGHLLALSVNRIFGYDRNDPTQESFNLNVAPSRGAGSTYKVFVAAAALARGYSTPVHADGAETRTTPASTRRTAARTRSATPAATGRRWT